MNLFLREFSASCKGIFESRSAFEKRLFSSGLFLFALLLSFEGLAQTTVPYNASGVFTVPAGVTSITVEAWGGGGGGGNSNNTTSNGGAGGGGGAYARKVLTGLIPGTSYTVTVGTGGTGAPANSTANATDGGDSRFQGPGITTIVAGGGKLGDASGENTNGTGGNNTGGNGGTATGGDVNYTGGNGGNGGSASGGGGGSSASTSTNGANGTNGNNADNDKAGGNVGGNTTDGPGGTGEGSNDNQPGGNGTIPGGGGGGSNDSPNSAGGNGAAGRVVVSYYECALGNQNDYGTNSWIGHVYDGANNFASANYLGRLTEAQNFDENFGGDFNDFPLGIGCMVYTETFSVRFRMALTITAATCGLYPVTIGGDDGVRLSINGGATWVMNTLYSDHAYTEATQAIYLAVGTHNLVLEYYENQTNNRVSFRMGTTGGQIGGDQTLCGASINPAAFTSITPAGNCSNGATTPAYQWQSSPNADFSAAVTNISPNGTSATYDPPLQAPVGTLYYRRRATFGGPAPATLYSNTVTIVTESPQGDQVTAGNNSWRGYVYDGADNFNSANYLGYLTAAQTFDYSFCGDDCWELITGCRFNTNTFTIRYRMNFTPATSQGYTFTIGADDGVRLSLDGGATYVLDIWGDHGYQEVTSGVIDLFAGTTYNMVLDYYENGGGNRVRFAYSTGPLPVVWRSFSAERVNNDVLLTWETAQEINNDHFGIERSEDGRHFYTLGEVDGAGNSTTPLAYQYLDKKVSYDQRHYYRIKQVDYDGKHDYSAIVAIQATAESVRDYWTVYPNPFASERALKVAPTESNTTDGYVSIVIISTVGQIVFRGSGLLEELNEKLEKAFQYFGTGVYVLQVSDGTHNEMFRIVRY